MPNVNSNTFIGGGDNDAVWVAPLGSTGPTTLSAPASPFESLGWLEESGISFDANIDKKEFKAAQGGTIVRRKITGSGKTFTFGCLETKLSVLGIALPGISWTKSGTAPNEVATGVVPAGITSVERAWVIDSYDGTKVTRWVIPDGEASLTGGFKYGPEDITTYTFELSVYGGATILTNVAGIVSAIT